MKFFLLLALVVLSACNDKPLKSADGVDSMVELLETDLDSDDAARVRAICNALSMKEDQLDILLSSEYTFSYAQKNCTEANLGNAANIAVTMERPYGNYVFMTKDGDSFPFQDVETYSNGIMANICKNTSGRIRGSFKTSKTGAMWITTISSTKHCSPSNTHYCVHVKRGSLVNGRSYRVHTDEWIKFKLDNPRRGFFVERKLVTSAGCSSGNTIVRQAVLK